MRITSNMYYKNMYGDSNSKLSKELFDVNKQISSGLQIQYAQDDVRTFTETMRLDNEITTLNQVVKSTESAYKFSTQTDSVLNEFQTSLDRTKVLLIQASNSSQSDDSMDAIASELRGLEDHFKNLANTSIDGKYLFSGSATNTKPIDSNGMYQGNDVTMSAFAGSNVKEDYNLTGQELFLGENSSINREITTNVPLNSLTAKYPDFTDSTILGDDEAITSESTIRDLMGDNDDDISNSNSSHFYINGTKSDGTSFNSHVEMSATDQVEDLLVKIGNEFGNSSAVDVVNVTLNQYGEIVIEDKMEGSSKIDFHMVGATDYNKTDGNDAANINDSIYNNATDRRGFIDNLDDGETNFESIINGTSEAANTNLYVKSFVKSPYDTVTTPSSELKSAEYVMDRAVVAGDSLSITVDNGDATTTTYTQAFVAPDSDATYAALKAQIDLAGDFTMEYDIETDTVTLNSTAQGVASGVSIDTALDNDNGSASGVVGVTETIVNSVIAEDIDTLLYDRTSFTKDGATLSSSIPQILNSSNDFATPSSKISEVADLSSGTTQTLDSQQFTISGVNTYSTPFTAQIDFNSAGSTFSLDGGVTNYNIYNAQNPRTAVDADEMTYQQLMDVTNMIVTNNIPSANTVSAYDKAVSDSQVIGSTMLSYDGKIQFEDLQSTNTNASLAIYDSNAGNFNTDSSVMTFNSNNALTVRDPKTDFFKDLDDIIKSIENHELYPDASNGDVRNVGIENAIKMVDDLERHVGKSRASVGSQSLSISNAKGRAELLEISTITLRSETIDTDLAESSLRLTQLQLNYEAMLSTVSQISKLSLVNYL